jgi:transcriptional regulator with AAA-type ATPase domain/tetratricopeptide (TPR) repeat protein
LYMKFLRTLVVDDAVDGRISQTPHPATVLHPTSPLMPSVVAERFVENGRAWIDLASGVPVRLRIERAGDRAAQIVWSDRCADLARIRHPLMNVLVDYGSLTNETTFEAYSAGGPVGLTAPMASLMLTHATRFLKSRGHTLTKETAVLLLRGTTVAHYSTRDRPLGIYLQPRGVLDTITDAMADATPGGVAAIDVFGGEGSGLRTVRLQAVRAARLAGYLPIASGVLLHLPWLRAMLRGRHLCVVLDEGHAPIERQSVAAFLAELGTESPRRHVLLRFIRGSARRADVLAIDPMEIGTMMSMVYVDPDCGPSSDELSDAARAAGGCPGRFVRLLRAASFDDQVPRVMTVHETAPSYIADSAGPAPATVRRGIGRALLRASDRAARLAAKGRHAAAVRLLSRASRVLEGRGELIAAAASAEQLAWIARDRGHSELAVEQFERARRLARDGPQRLISAIGIGIVWTDERRFLEADAALRAACAAADLLADPAIANRAARALARSLFWQRRYDEALVMLERLVQCGGASADTWALLARTRVVIGDVRGAVAAGSESVMCAEREQQTRASATAARAMAVVQAALGDTLQTRHWVERGLRAATTAHLPLVAYRLRGLIASERQRVGPQLPALLRSATDGDSGKNGDDGSAGSRPSQERAVAELKELLEAAQSAPDDGVALQTLCRLLHERLRTATVQIVAGVKDLRVLASAGRQWHGDLRIAEELLAGRSSNVLAALSCEPRRAAEAIRYGRETIAALCCRWTAGTVTDNHRVAAIMSAGALAAAGPVRSLLDRPDPVVTHGACSELIGTSSVTGGLREAIARAARAPFPVLIEGESGSGKELVARAIHRLSARRERRLCTVNCAALTDDLLEAELFGHTRGAFTGAVGDRQGLFEEADGGTLFLDEVGELSARAQAKLLRVLQDGEVRRVGENMPRRVDVRIIAASNRRLGEEVDARRFRADLRFRLDVVRIVVPPLRERSTDIPALALHFWTDAARRVGSSATLTPEAVATLSRYDWPGNIRELQNVVASLAVHAPRRGRVTANVLPAHIASTGAAHVTTFDAARYDFERRFIRAALAQAGGQRARAARAMGVSRQGLAKMIRRLRIEA